MLIYAAIFIAWCWLLATLGLWMAFRYRRKGIGLAVAIPVALVMIASNIAMCIAPIWLPVPVNGMLVLGGSAIAAFVLGWVAYLMTVKYVRKTTG